MALSSIPLIRQTTDADCGLACLSMLLGVSLFALKARFSVGHRGMSARELIDAARSQGVNARAYRLTFGSPAELVALKTPSILHYSSDHFVVLTAIDANRATVNDPALGIVTYSLQELAARVSGAYITVEGQPAATNTYTALKPLFAEVAGYMRTNWDLWALSLILVLGTAATGILVPAYLSDLVISLMDDQRVAQGAWTVAGVALSLLAINWARMRLNLAMQLETERHLSIQFVSRVLQLPIRIFANVPAGDLLSRLDAVRSVREFLTNRLATTASDVVVVSIVALVVAVKSLLLLGALAATVLPAILLIAVMWRSCYRTLANEVTTRVAAQQVFTETIMSAADVKSTRREDAFVSRWKLRFDESIDAALARGKVAAITDIAFSYLDRVLPIVMLAISLMFVSAGRVERDTALEVFFLTYWGAGPLRSLLASSMQLMAITLNLERIRAIQGLLETNEATVQETSSADAPVAIAVKDLGFSYRGTGRPTLEHINFDATGPGITAIVGPSGSGKSSLLRILAGLTSGDAGSITVSPSLHSGRVIYLPQHPTLFEGSIRDNIALFDASMDEATVIAAAQAACVDQDITSTPGGYAARLSERGGNLSSGQRQRIALARAIASKPSVLILDEFTSDVDGATERRITANLRKLNIRVIAATHRRDWIQPTDEILELVAGRVAYHGPALHSRAA